MRPKAPTWEPPRLLSPATATRTVSLAPMTRPEDLVPPMAKLAPTPAAARERPRNCRRLQSDFDMAPAPPMTSCQAKSLTYVCSFPAAYYSPRDERFPGGAGSASGFLQARGRGRLGPGRIRTTRVKRDRGTIRSLRTIP